MAFSVCLGVWESYIYVCISDAVLYDSQSKPIFYTIQMCKTVKQALMVLMVATMVLRMG